LQKKQTNSASPRRPAQAQNRARTQTAGAKSASKAPAARAKRPAPAKQSKAAQANSRDPKLAIVFLAGLIFIIGCYFLQKHFPTGMHVGNQVNRVSEIDAAVGVRITEVMSSNSSVIQDDTGEYPDWIEITNTSSSSVNLHGYKLAKDTSIMLKYFEFPNHTLKSGESTVVYATSTARNNYGYAYHAPFKISAAGDTLILFNPSDVAIQSLNIPAMTSNQSYAEIGGEWVVTNEYTPFLENTRENYLLIRDSRETVESPIKITEFMASSITFAPDENGEHPDWIEIYNSSDYTVSLSGYALTDSEDNLQKWLFPNISIDAGEYLLVYASGYDRRDPSGNLHTNFKLNTEKECVILTNASGQMIDRVMYDLLKDDQSYSRQADDSWTTLLPPTPGMSNSYESAALIDGQFAAQNSRGLFINEVMATTSTANASGASYDWVEIYNRSGQAIDLAGFGISDDPAAPRKWQFPDGASIPSGGYMGVMLSGRNDKISGYYHTSFRLSSTEGETLVLSDPSGRILDRVSLGSQYSNISYGRISGANGFYYLSASTPMTANASTGSYARARTPAFSQTGGLYAAGETITLTLSAEPGATIYYTLDCSEPSPENIGGKTFTLDPRITENRSDRYETFEYTGPITITDTTIVRAISMKNGQLPSLVNTQTYFMGVSHTMQVISLVMNPYDLWDYNKGLYVYGPNAYPKSPYGALDQGANFWMTWEKDSNIEMFSTEGETILSQGCGIRLHGQYSRKEDQKPFKVIARSKYGVNRFYAPLFPNRDYTEYQSFLLRSSGQDWDKTRMRDSVLTALAEGSSVMYQDTALAIVYLNGEYWGHYNLRERINTFSICQWEGWDPAIKDEVDLVKANTSLMNGSLDTWTEFKKWYEKNGIDTAAELEYANKFIDVDNYLEYVAVQIFTGNTDLLNCKKYRSDLTDGRWRWAFFDTDWAFVTDTNSVGRWLAPGGVGSGNKTDNSLFIALMKNPVCKDQFLTYFADKLAGDWSSESVVNLMYERYQELEPEINQHLERWNVKRSKYDSEIASMRRYAETRPGRLLYFFRNSLGEKDFEKYFGTLAQSIKLIDDKGKSFNYK